MTTKQLSLKGIIALIAILVSACSPDVPNKAIQANDENCNPQNLTAMKDRAAQQALARACTHRGEFKPSEKKSW